VLGVFSHDSIFIVTCILVWWIVILITNRGKKHDDLTSITTMSKEWNEEDNNKVKKMNYYINEAMKWINNVPIKKKHVTIPSLTKNKKYFIPKTCGYGAMHNDKVIIEILPKDKWYKPTSSNFLKTLQWRWRHHFSSIHSKNYQYRDTSIPT